VRLEVIYSFSGRASSKQSIFFFGSNRNKPKLDLFRLFFGLFCETKKHFFRFVLVCFSVSDRYRNNRNKQSFLETNRKNLQKTFSIRGSAKKLIFFLGSNRKKPKLNLFSCFSVCYFTKPQYFFFGLFRFVSMFQTGIETTKTNRNNGMGN
jgi:hypothetical protein